MNENESGEEKVKNKSRRKAQEKKWKLLMETYCSNSGIERLQP